MSDGRKIFYAPFTQEAIGADATNDWWSILGTSAVRVRLLGWEITSSAIAAAAVAANLQFITAQGTGGTDPGLEQNADDSKTTASLVTMRFNDITTQGTGGGILHGYEWEQLGPLGHIYTPEMAPISAAGNGFALTAVSAVAFTMSGFVCWEEIYV